MRTSIKTLSALVALCFVALPLIGIADDTDIYVGGNAPPDSEPIVMFSLDWRPSLGARVCQGTECDFLKPTYLSPVGPYTYFDLLRAVLKKVMGDPQFKGVKVGLMMNHDYKNSCAGPVVKGKCSNGGFIALGAKSFSDPANKTAFFDYLDSIPLPQGNASHNYQGKELFFELYRYLTGGELLNGHVGFMDFQTADTVNMDAEPPLIPGKSKVMWDSTAEAAGRYISPLATASACTSIATINIMFQVSQQDADSDAFIEAEMTPLNRPTFPDVIEWLNDKDLSSGVGGLEGTQNVTSYFIVDPTKINTTTRGYAVAGGTNAPLPLSDNPEDLIDTLTNVLDQILSVSTTFVSASIPVNVFNRAEIIDNVFIAVFEADDDNRPFWPGNVKKLKVAGIDVGSPVLVDNSSPVKAAIAPDGRIAFDALTHWTDVGLLQPADTAAGEVPDKDGRVVTRGGVAQQITGFRSGNLSDRKIYIENLSGDLERLTLAMASDTDVQAAIGAANQTEAERVIKFMLGHDVFDLDADGDVDEPRDWLFGDPLHSRPLPINFGDALSGYNQDNPGILIAVGSNDGYMRLLRNTEPNSNATDSGEEMWAFMPREVMAERIKHAFNMPGVKHPYMVDGAPVSYVSADRSTAWLFFGLRRGGSAYYAMDISDPEAPSLMWKVTDADLPDLGSSFSTPRVIMVKPDPDADAIPALIFAGGYDTDKDYANNPGVGTDDDQGTAIFVLNAETGDLIWKATHLSLVDSIASTVSVADIDGDGLQDRFYVGDTGGNIWRGDLPASGKDDWSLTHLARLGRHATGASGKATDLRFFHRPDIVLSADSDGAFDAVVVASGDRTDPLDKAGVANNWLFMLKDRAVGVGSADASAAPIEPSDLGDVTSTCVLNDGECTADLTNGWRLQLQANGEKGLATPLTIANTVYFTSYVPPGASAEGVCSPAEGNGRLYAVSLKNANAINDYDTTTEEEERYTELKSRGIPAEVVSLPPSHVLRPDLQTEETASPTRLETFWFEEEDGDL